MDSQHQDVKNDNSDRLTSGGGLEDIRAIFRFLEASGVSCCVVDVPALNYYGAKRVVLDWQICVPQLQMKQALDALQSHHNVAPCGRSLMLPSSPFTIDHTYPRFKFNDMALFFVIQPDFEYYFECTPSNIEYCPFSGLPFPTAPAFAQSLLDAYRISDLHDLVDGLDLDEGWGAQYLDLDSYTDSTRMKEAGEREGERILLARPHLKRDLWKKCVQTKQTRMGIKYPKGIYATRFRKIGSKDPRETVREKRLQLTLDKTPECPSDP